MVLNISETKELFVSFKRNKDPIEPSVINDEEVEIIDVFKLLGAYMLLMLCHGTFIVIICTRDVNKGFFLKVSFISRYHLYADDSQLYKGSQLNYLCRIKERNEKCIEDVKIWMDNNKLKLNNDKIKLIIFKNKHTKLKTIFMKHFL